MKSMQKLRISLLKQKIKNLLLKKKLTKALKQKELYLSTAAHELKTPLAVISSYIQLIEKRFNSNRQIKKPWIKSIIRNSRKLEKLIIELFAAAKISTGTFSYSYKPVKITALIKKICTDLSQLHERTIALTAQSEFSIIADPMKLQILFTNIISNAVKYSPNTAAIKVSIKQKNTSVLIQVSDEGSGIPQSETDKIFERNYRISNTKKNGLGLGLYLSKEIVTEHSGTIEIHSEENNGTTVLITLPLREVL